MADEEEMLIACKDEEISVVAATSIFMRLDLNRTLRGFRSYIYSIDEFLSISHSKIVHLPTTYHFYKESSRGSVGAPWRELRALVHHNLFRHFLF